MADPVHLDRLTTLRVERDDAVVTVTLDRPQVRNAINGPMWDELLAVFTDLARTAVNDRVVVITGAGDAFTSGADLSDTGAGNDPHVLAAMRHIHAVCAALHGLPQPTIAKVNGVAAGAGCNLALGCDLIVASETARFSEIFARRGLSLDFGGSWVLPRLVGIHRAKELALFGDVIDAAEADRIGLVNRVVPAAELDDFVATWAARLAAGPPLALSLSKRLLDEGLHSSLPQALEAEAAAQAVNASTSDAREAMRAFLEKREPTFRGR